MSGPTLLWVAWFAMLAVDSMMYAKVLRDLTGVRSELTARVLQLELAAQRAGLLQLELDE